MDTRQNLMQVSHIDLGRLGRHSGRLAMKVASWRGEEGCILNFRGRTELDEARVRSSERWVQGRAPRQQCWGRLEGRTVWLLHSERLSGGWARDSFVLVLCEKLKLFPAFCGLGRSILFVLFQLRCLFNKHHDIFFSHRVKLCGSNHHHMQVRTGESRHFQGTERHWKWSSVFRRYKLPVKR